MKEILLRFDDICPTMNHEQWNYATNLMDKYGIKPLIGVIPDCKDHELNIDKAQDNFWSYIRNLQNNGYKIAMHGVYHVYNTNKQGLVDCSHHSEFAGVSYTNQYNMLKHGLDILRENKIETDTFFAPAHSYDVNTIKALSKLGFKYMVDGKSLKPIFRYRLLCVPCRDGGVPHIDHNGYHICVFHAHEWSNKEKQGERDKFTRICNEEHNNIVSFEKYIRRKQGNYFIQNLDEMLYVFYDRYLHSTLSRIKHSLIR